MENIKVNASGTAFSSPMAFANNVITAICAVYAFVEATAISGPA